MPYATEQDVKALFNRSTIYLPEGAPGGAGWVANTTHYDCCYYDRMQERKPFGHLARQWLLLLCLVIIILIIIRGMSNKYAFSIYLKASRTNFSVLVALDIRRSTFCQLVNMNL